MSVQPSSPSRTPEKPPEQSNTGDSPADPRINLIVRERFTGGRQLGVLRSLASRIQFDDEKDEDENLPRVSNNSISDEAVQVESDPDCDLSDQANDEILLEYREYSLPQRDLPLVNGRPHFAGVNWVMTDQNLHPVGMSQEDYDQLSTYFIDRFAPEVNGLPDARQNQILTEIIMNMAARAVLDGINR